ncbi:uncharacterized protein LOC119731897 [Patiria miniata]|uniref:Uncharacterized protein n=1 Tax=Patiria miniata TaxID=46514 RepID=A0A914AB75_PATMI|nr:uncharacterized protein LOC119731897 [Patiria miniata]
MAGAMSLAGRLVDHPQRYGASIGHIGTVSGSTNPTIVGSTEVNFTFNSPREGPGSLFVATPGSSLPNGSGGPSALNYAQLEALVRLTAALVPRNSLATDCIDILALTETWFRAEQDRNTASITPKGYKLVHIPRKGRRCGGVGLVYKSSLTASVVKQCSHPPPSSFESMEVDIHNHDNKHFRIIVLYRPPHSSLTTFMDEFASLLDWYALFTGQLIILGDFNIHWNNDATTSTPSANDRRFGNLLTQFNMQQLVTTGTHTSGHTIDFVITRQFDTLVQSVDTSDFVSDHCAVHCRLDLRKPRYVRHKITFRKITAIDPTKFKDDIATSPLITCPADTPDTLVDQYNSVLCKLLDSHAPPKTCKIVDKPKMPWYNNDIAEAKRKRRQLERRWRKSKLQIHREMFQSQRDLVKSKYSKISKIRNDLAEMDPGINPAQADLEFCQSPLLSLAPASDTEVMKIVKSAPTKTCPLDPIPTSLVKDHINVLIHPITLIINKSLATGHFPTCFKTALITPVIKKKSLDSNDLKNYRPISNMPFMSKVVERVVATRLNAHLIQHNLRDNLQSAYTKFHSVETALVKVHNDIMLAVDNKRVVLLVLLDLSAAFDTVDHKILLHRLQYHFGVQGSALSWFRSYLQDRSQAVNISGELSDRCRPCGDRRPRNRFCRHPLASSAVSTAPIPGNPGAIAPGSLYNPRLILLRSRRRNASRQIQSPCISNHSSVGYQKTIQNLSETCSAFSKQTAAADPGPSSP